MPRLSRLAAVAPLFALLALAGCSKPEEAPATPYNIRIEKGCFWDIDHNDYDAALPGFWFVGTDGTLTISRAKDAVTPESFAFMIKTRATANADSPSRLEKILFITGRYQVHAAYTAKGAAPVNIIGYFEKKEGTELVPVSQDKDGKFVKVEQVGERVKITLTKRGLDLLGPDIVFSWSENPEAAAKSRKAEELKAAERARIIMK